MKMVDFDYHASMFNAVNGVSDEVARLDFPQRYVRLVDCSGRVFDLEIADVNRDEFLLRIRE